MKMNNGDFLDQLANLRQEVGGFLQDIRTFGEGLFLSFWSSESGISGWYFDLQAGRPSFLKAPADSRPPLKSKTSPLELFLKAHFKNRSLQSVEWMPGWGRVLKMEFGSGLSLEVRLFPHGTNAIAIADDKTVAFNKPVDINPIEWQNQDPATPKLSVETKWQKHFARLQTASKSSKTPSERMKKAIEKLEKSLQSDEEQKWKQIGFDLQAGVARDLPFPDLDIAQNIQKSFEKAKQEKQNRVSRVVRLEELKKQLAVSEREYRKKPAVLKSVDLFIKANSKGQTAHLSSGHKVYFGKSASDNLKLLRAAAPSDFWFHVKDLPGSHAILKRNKKEKLGDALMLEAAKALLEFQFRNKMEKYTGQKFEVLCAEIRYVKPIKGDKLGRVTYSQASTLLIQL